MRSALSIIIIIGVLLPRGAEQGGQGPCMTQPIGERRGPYLGEIPPGSEPKVFASNLVSSACSEHSVPAFSPDGREAVWTRMVEGSRKARLLYTREEPGGWTEPGIATFITGGDAFYPFFSADGGEIYYVSRDLFSRSLKRTRRGEDGWSRPRKVGSPLADRHLMWSASMSETGTVYFVLTDDEGVERIYRARRANGGYGDKERLPEEVNLPGYSASTPFIARDESYLLFSSPRPGGGGAWDIFISFIAADGSWSDACSLGPTINTGAIEHSPGVTPDGAYLFFIRGADVYWVKADALERSREGGCGGVLAPAGQKGGKEPGGSGER